MNTAEILRAAKARIDTPEKWGKASDRSVTLVAGQRECAFMAIGGAALDGESALEGQVVFSRANDIPTTIWRAGFNWNDAPERTHAEVMAAFDRAIALAALNDRDS